MDNATDPVTGRPVATRTDVAQTTQSPQAIAEDIRETRSDMSETLSALGDKLDPSNLVDQAKEAFSTSARDAGASLLDAAKDSSVMDTIKENPIPAMAVGLSLAWFLSKIGENESSRYRRDRYEATGDPMYAPVYGASRQRPQGPGSGTFDVDAYERRTRASGGHASGDGGLMDKAADALDTAKDTATDLAQDAKEAVMSTAGDVRDRASDLASNAGDAVPGRRDAQRYSRQATGWLDRQLESNPLAVGAVALAAGALVGLSLPETRAENELVGEQAESVKRQALSAAKEKAGVAQEALADVADEAKAKTQEVAETAKEKAQAVGDKAATEAERVAGKAETEAKKTAETAKEEAKAKTPGATASGATASGAKPSGAKAPASKKK